MKYALVVMLLIGLSLAVPVPEKEHRESERFSSRKVPLENHRRSERSSSKERYGGYGGFGGFGGYSPFGGYPQFYPYMPPPSYSQPSSNSASNILLPFLLARLFSSPAPTPAPAGK
ncbi:uncharacterized protein si:dkey-22i16.7 [Brienomyrus brachyistius]|uniref:uncharacterized protein si:dkey-22i16.7 n=1 Tax=Brienomyrus brachyistius TaxID=42636 RepID=UPI0020B35881|nr:uncharacterized protein si:dkey-22i16.7 [Brienomyrus brachyistius]